MAIDPAKREAFRGVLQKMIDDGAPEEVVQEATAKFKAKYDSGSTVPPGQGMGDLRMAESQGADPGPDKSNIFPGAIQEYQNRFSRPAGSVGQSLKDFGAVGLAGMGDVFGTAQRGLAAAFTDQKMSDPGAHALKNQTDRNVQDYGRQMDAYRGDPRAFGAPAPTGVGEFITETTGRLIDDPLSYAGLVAKSLSYIPSLFRGAGSAAGGVNRFAGFTAAKASGVPEEALRAAGSPYGRARMDRWFGRENEIGADVLNRLDDAPNQIPEAAQKNAILEKLPNMSVSPTIEAGAARLSKFGEGTAGRGLAPHEVGGANQAKEWIDYLRGGSPPADLTEAAQKAGGLAQDTKAASIAKGAQAAMEAKEAARAERIASAAQTKAAKAAAKAGHAKKQFLGAADLAEKNRLRWTGERDAIGQAAEAAMEEAQAAAVQARQTAITARAKVAVGAVSEAEAVSLESQAESAVRSYYAAEVAARYKTGEGIGGIAEDLAKRGMPKDALSDALMAGKKRVESLKQLPPDEMTAKELDRLRQKLDPNIDWLADPDAADIKDKVLGAMRTDISKRMMQNAEASGNAEWSSVMRRFHEKLAAIDKMKDMIGKTSKIREKRIEAVVNNLFGKNKKWQQKFLNEFESNFGGNTVSRAKAADMAKKFGETGKPGILPAWGTGASVSMGVNSALLLPRAGAALLTAGTASPWVASRVTLPMLTKLEQGLKATGVALTPKSQSLLAAMKRPISDAQRARIASILAAELEAQLPANAIPFRMKDAASVEEESQYTQR